MLVAIPTIQLALWCPETRTYLHSRNTLTIHTAAHDIFVLLSHFQTMKTLLQVSQCKLEESPEQGLHTQIMAVNEDSEKTFGPLAPCADPESIVPGGPTLTTFPPPPAFCN